jgi:hypothetical protein
MSRYRKRPVVVDAVQLRWDTWGDVCDFAQVGALSDGRPQGCYVTVDGEGVEKYPGPDARLGLWIPTLEGLMLGVQGDWIIRGVQGELYPCKPDIFAATYEAVPA